MPRTDLVARALLGWAPWVLLPVFALYATGEAGDAALAAAGGFAVLLAFYRLSPKRPPPALGTIKPFKAEPGPLTVTLDEAKPLRPARDITDAAVPESVFNAPIPALEPARLALEIASAPAFIAVGWLEHGAKGADWAGALLYTGLACAALFGIVAPVAALVSRAKAERTPVARGWGPFVPLAAAALAVFFFLFGLHGLYVAGAAAFGLAILMLIVQDYKDAWHGRGRHRRH